jgi:hypothetical protein
MITVMTHEIAFIDRSSSTQRPLQPAHHMLDEQFVLPCCPISETLTGYTANMLT